MLRKYSIFVRDQRGSMTIIFALVLIGVFGVAGLAIDTLRTERVRKKVELASDAAALSAVRYAAEQTALGRDKATVINEAVAQATALWKANLDRLDVPPTDPTFTLTQTGSDWQGKVTASGTVTTSLSAIMGMQSMSYGVQVTTTTSAGTPYMDFYLLLDTSQSMGLASTSAGLTQLKSATGCQFGCHVTGQSSTYDYAKANSIPLRVDVLRTATDKVLQKAQDTAVRSDQFRIGLWTYDRSTTKLSDLDTNYAALQSAATLIDLPTYDDGTQTDDALSQMASMVPNSGNGQTAANPVKFLFLVTDGVQDGIYTGWTTPAGLPTNYPYSPSDGIVAGKTSPIMPTACDAIKAKGVTVVVLYTTYVPFPGAWQYDDLIAPFASSISTNLKSCASPGFYFEATEGPDIDAAMQKMFAAAVAYGGGPRVVK